jgi:hypothetical protein
MVRIGQGERFGGHMLLEMARMSVDDGLVMLQPTLAG